MNNIVGYKSVFWSTVAEKLLSTFCNDVIVYVISFRQKQVCVACPTTNIHRFKFTTSIVCNFLLKITKQNPDFLDVGLWKATAS